MTLRHHIKTGRSPRKALFRWAGWFGFFNAGLIALAISRYFRFTGPIEGVLSYVYAATILIGHPLFLAFGVAFALLFPVILIRPWRPLIFSLGIIAATVGIAILMLDYVVYSQFRVHLNKVMLDLVIGGGREIFDFSWQNYAIALLCMAGILFFQIFIAWIVWKKIVRQTRRMKGLLLTGMAFLCIIASHGIHAWSDAQYYRPVTALTRHFPLYYPLTAKRLLQEYGLVDLAASRVQRTLKINPGTNKTMLYPLSKLRFTSGDQRLNVLFIVIDSWRFDMLNQAVTPNIQRFISARPVWRFTRHLSGGNGTRIGIFSLFYGLSGVHWDAMTNEQIGPVFIRELLNRDYQMGIFASAKLTTPPFDRNVFIDIKNLRSRSKGDSAWERDQSVLGDWSQWLEARDSEHPFFGFIFFDAAHTYSMPPNYPEVFKPMWSKVNYLALNENLDPVPFFNRYKVSLHYIDSLVEHVLSGLKQNKLIENTIIVITGDHGQEFNDTQRNFWGHGGNYTDYQIQVPMVIYWPGRDAKKIMHQTSHLDVVPTLLTDLLGCQNPMTDYSDGRHLFEANGRDWLVVGGYFNYAIREIDRITMAYSSGNYEIFDLNHHIIKGARLNYRIVGQAMTQSSRFYKGG